MSNHTLIRSMLNMCVKCSTRRRNYSLWFPSNGGSSTHQKAITNAEKLVGYPSSFSSLKYLAEEEPANFLGLAKKLVGSGHPLLLTARDLLSQDSHIGHSLGGLWVLLLSKAVGHNSSNGEILESQLVNGIHLKQRIIADTTELINTGKTFSGFLGLVLGSFSFFYKIILCYVYFIAHAQGRIQEWMAQNY